ncbi:MAG: DUF4013 domain-containing protein [Methanoregula sp.]|jgi:hypothetical protein|nr:DUF4013 domain-containing protein [Methanoregula sp.]
MDFEPVISESIAYTQEAFMGKWTRWIIFVILGLPMALLPFVFDVNTIAGRTNFNWDQVPWGQVAAIIIAGILLSFFLSGYVVRIYRGVKPAPDFDEWGSLFLDGLKVQILSLIWILPLLIVILAALGLSIVGLASPGSGSIGLLLVLLLMFAIMMVLAIVVSLFVPMALIRFARMGSIREGLRFSAISEHIGKMGWGQYIIALIILFVVMFIFGLVVMVLSLIPFIGWVLQLIATPLLTVFTARYYTRIYDLAGEQPVPALTP